MKVVLAGGSGSLGRRLVADLHERGHEPVVLSRRSRPDIDGARFVVWDGKTVGEWARELDGAAVINLAGEIVDRRPTKANIALVTRSRVEPTRALIGAASKCTTRPPVWIQLSTVAIHGDGGETELDDWSPPAEAPPQMAGVARAWETAVADAPTDRLVIARPSVVLDRDSPALDRLLGLAKWGLGGSIASGQQWVSWIHIDDFVAFIRWALEDSDVHGAYAVSSPNPVRNAELMAALRRVTHRKFGMPTPTFLVHVGALLLRTDPALALTGRKVIPRRMLNEGFEFAFPDLDGALAALTN